MPKHIDGFIAINPPEVLRLLDSASDVQFWQLANWPQLFLRCNCCETDTHQGAYQMISRELARQWAEEHDG